MKIIVKKSDILIGLSRVQNIASKTTTMPILANVLFHADNNMLSIFGTDLSIGIKGEYPCDVLKGGKIALPSKRLYDIIRELPDFPVTIELLDNYWVNVLCGNISFKVSGINPEEFPKVPETKEEAHVVLDGNLLLKLIRKTIHAISVDDSRINISGMLWNLSEDGLELVSTDGHRLSKVKTSIKSGDTRFKVTVPRKGIQEIKKILEESDGDVSLGVSKNYIVLKKDGLIIVIRLIDSEFPDYKRIISDKNEYSIMVNKEALKQGVKRVSLMSNERTKAIKLSASKNKIELNSSDPEVGEAKEVIDSGYDGELVVIGFNSRYLADGIDVIDGDSICIEFNDPLSPCILKGPGDAEFLGVIMPMRV